MNKKIMNLVLLLGMSQGLLANDDAKYQDFLRKKIKSEIARIEENITKEEREEQLDNCTTTKQLEALLKDLNKKLAAKK